MAKDDKSIVFEYMFESRWDNNTKTLTDPLFMLEDVSQAIAACNALDGKKRSTRNPANFVKDYPRHRNAANKKWPKRIKDAGYTIKQRTGGGKCFEFVKMQPGEQPFPLIGNWQDAERLHTQSLSMPLASRRLGRKEEAWLTQVAVRLRLVEAYFSLSNSQRNIIEIDHLQMNAKLSSSEIDSIYRYTEKTDGEEVHGLILLEAKMGEDVSHDQLVNALHAGKVLLDEETHVILIMAIKALNDSAVHVLEFEPVDQDDIDGTTDLDLLHEAVIELHPPVPGI
jgi:hypothetical protein